MNVLMFWRKENWEENVSDIMDELDYRQATVLLIACLQQAQFQENDLSQLMIIERDLVSYRNKDLELYISIV